VLKKVEEIIMRSSESTFTASELVGGAPTPQQSDLLKQFDQNLTNIRPVLLEKLGEKDAVSFHKEAMQFYAAQVIPQIPYIGGKKNPYTRFLVQTTMALAIYRTMQKRGRSLEEAGETLYKGMLTMFGSMPKLFLHLYGRFINSRPYYPTLRKQARASQLRKYAEDWVYEFVDGNGNEFDYGIDMYECGIMKFLEAQDAGELTPYLCAVDYITHNAMGIELRRTQTLAYGCEKCDFRFIVKGAHPVDPSWPPAFPEQNCAKQNQ
jgi:hypothetical protein